MNWNDYLAEGETLAWEGRPAPRAFTFRNGLHSLFGVLLLVGAIFWQVIACGLAKAQPWPWPALIPVPFLLAGLYLTFGHLLLARLEWSRVGYAVSNRRLLACFVRGSKISNLQVSAAFASSPWGPNWPMFVP